MTKVKVNPITLEEPASKSDKLQATVATLNIVRTNYLTELQNLRNKYEPKIDKLLKQIQKLSDNKPEW